MNSRIEILKKFVLFFLAIILFLYAIIVAKNFLYPIAFGVLLSYLLFPIANFLERNRIPRILSILISIIFAIGIIYGIFTILYSQITKMAGDAQQLRATAFANIENIKAFIESTFGIKASKLERFLNNTITNLFSSQGGISQAFSTTTGTILKIGIMPVYIFLFLYYRTKFAKFILKLVPENKKILTLDILREVSHVATRYMGGMFIVVLILCILNSTGLMIIGLEHAIVLGIISAFCNFIPYFGTLIGASFPLLYSLLLTENPTLALKVIFVFFLVQFTENNILTPNIVGENLKLSPFFIILGLVAGATVWGIPGMLVAVPTLAIFKIICENVDALKPYSYLLGMQGTQKHSISKQNILKKYRQFRNLFKK